jgi:purine-binding chemotaxis protein CheW
MGDTVSLATCYVEHHLFGIEIGQVQEVTRAGYLTPLPLVARPVCGLLNLRGQIVAVVDLRLCLHLGERPAGTQPVHLILNTAASSVSVLVDRIGDVLVVDEDDFEEPPDTMRGPVREFIRGAYKLDAALLLALDTQRLLNEMERIYETEGVP